MAVDKVKLKTNKAFRKPMFFFNPVQFEILRRCIAQNPQCQNDLVKELTKKFKTQHQYIYQMIWKLEKEQLIEVKKTYPALIVLNDETKIKIVNYLTAFESLFELKLTGKRMEKAMAMKSSRDLGEVLNGKNHEEETGE